MGKVYETIDDKLRQWVEAQKMFIVATAPLSGDGLINCSPKGMDTFRILGPTTVAYLDLTGSGIETIAHLKENGRIIIMFMAFEGGPKIVRFHGKGVVYEKGSDDFARQAQHFPDLPGARAVIQIEVNRIADSCGFSVPLYDYVSDRDILVDFSRNLGEEKLQYYRENKNSRSLDGLRGYEGK